MNDFNILIIGGGASGMLLSYHLLSSQAAGRLKIGLIEMQQDARAGAAYSTHSPAHLLNVPADAMGALEGAPEDFYRWLVKKNIHVEPKSFVSRALYGDYLNDLLDSAVVKSASRHHFERIEGEVISVAKAPSSGYQITLSSGRVLLSAYTVLATGNARPTPPLPLQPFSEKDGLFKNPWCEKTYLRAENERTLIIIGTGLSAVDVVLQMEQIGYQGRYHLISRHGLLPFAHEGRKDFPITPLKIPELGNLALAELFKAVRILCEKSTSWQMTLDSLRPQTQRLWSRLSLKEKSSFLRHLRSYWDVHRHRIPTAARAKLEHLQKLGRLEIIAGRISAAEKKESGLALTIAPRHPAQPIRKICGERVILCTGPSSSIDTPVFHSLRKQGMLHVSLAALGPRVSPQGELLDASGKPQPALLALGPVRRGELWETTAMREIRAQAREIAEKIVHTLVPTGVVAYHAEISRPPQPDA